MSSVIYWWVYSQPLQRLVDCCIKKTDGIRGHGDQSCKSRPWTHHRISHETTADRSSFGACLPTCGVGSEDQESVWGIGLNILSDIQLLLNIPWTVWTKTVRPVRLVSSTLILGAERNSYISWYGKENGPLLIWLSSIDAHVAPGEDCCITNTAQDFLEAPCYTLIILNISLWENPRPNNQTILSTITDRMAWLPPWFEILICIQRRLQLNMIRQKCTTLPLRQLGESAFLRKKADRDRTTVIVDHKKFVRGSREVFKILLRAYFDTDTDFHQMWGKKVALVGWFHSNGWQCMHLKMCKMSTAINTSWTALYQHWTHILTHYMFKSGKSL